jgi:hypothetical protein
MQVNGKRDKEVARQGEALSCLLMGILGTQDAKITIQIQATILKGCVAIKSFTDHC